MRYIKFCGGTEYLGTDYEQVDAYPDDITDEDLNDEAKTIAESNAEDCEYLATGWDDDFQSEEDREAYYDSIWYSWQPISEEKYKELGDK